MKFPEIRKKIGALTLQTRSVLEGARAGAFRVRATGSGYDFDQLREYQEGDDYRRIDWKNSARSNALLLREYKDERSRTMHVVLDCSASMAYGTQQLLVSDVAREVALAFIAMAAETDDDIALHCAVAQGTRSYAPRGGERHVVHLAYELEKTIESQGQASLKATLETIGQRYPRRSLVVIISDFIDEGYEQAVRYLARRHEVVIVRLRDVHEQSVLAASAAIACQDSEVGSLAQDLDGLETGTLMQRWRNEQEQAFRRLQIPLIDCYNDTHHLATLIQFVRRYF